MYAHLVDDCYVHAPPLRFKTELLKLPSTITALPAGERPSGPYAGFLRLLILLDQSFRFCICGGPVNRWPELEPKLEERRLGQQRPSLGEKSLTGSEPTPDAVDENFGLRRHVGYPAESCPSESVYLREACATGKLTFMRRG